MHYEKNGRQSSRGGMGLRRNAWGVSVCSLPPSLPPSCSALLKRGFWGDVLTLDSTSGCVEGYLAKREFGHCLRRGTE